MSVGNKEPRFCIRFPDFTIPDKVEIEANRVGLKKNAWVREAINEKFVNDAKTRLLKKESVRGDLESRKLIQMIAGPDLTNEAKKHVTEYLEKVEHHVAAE